MSDAVPDSNPPTRWLWVALLVALGVAVVIIFFNPEGDADDDVTNVTASEQAEERLDTDLEVNDPTLPEVQGVDAPEETPDVEIEPAE